MLVKATSADREKLLAYLSDEACANIFLIGDINLYGFDQDFQEVYYQMNHDEMCAVLVIYHGGFVIYSKQRNHDAGELAAFYEAKKGTLMQGLEEVIRPIHDILGDEKSIYSRKFFAELNDDSKLLPIDSQVKQAKEEDGDLIADAYLKIDEFKTAYPGDHEALKQTFISRMKHKEGRHFMLIKDDMVIAHANSAAENGSAAIIGGVLCIPKYRRRGYALAVVNVLCHDLLSRGIHPCLFYDNESAGNMYHKLGFVNSGFWAVATRKD